MKQKLVEHAYSVLFVGLLLVILSFILHVTGRSELGTPDPLIQKLSEIKVLRPEHPLHRTLLLESLRTYYPHQNMNTDSLIDAVIAWRRQEVLADIDASRKAAGMSFSKFGELLSMYGSFVFVFIVVMFLIYYGAQTLGLFQFVVDKRRRPSLWQSLYISGRVFFSKASKAQRKSALKNMAVITVRAMAKTLFYIMVFSPAYVMAYSFKTNFETDSMLFLIFLGTFTNGVLITFMYKFYVLLNVESRKGYVETAVAKSLSRDYHAINNRQIFAPLKRFPDHVLEHIFIHTRYQYLGSIKEQGSTVITGLIIVEMALNIQGHLGYELLKNILYRNWDVVLIIVFGIFLLVKMTETAADVLMEYESNKYENRNNA
ncbi:hypothetical protein JNM05_03660 [bacterium]|nr:hypothetical protein [bacterium]